MIKVAETYTSNNLETVLCYCSPHRTYIELGTNVELVNLTPISTLRMIVISEILRSTPDYLGLWNPGVCLVCPERREDRIGLLFSHNQLIRIFRRVESLF